MEKELCKVCDTETGNAGIHDGSLLFDVGDGPYCDDCYDKESVKRLNNWISEDVMDKKIMPKLEWALSYGENADFTSDLRFALAAVAKHCKADYEIKLFYSMRRGVFDCTLWSEEKRHETINTCHKNPATAVCMGLYELITEKEWPDAG